MASSAQSSKAKTAEAKRIVTMIRAGMADAEIKSLLDLASASGISYPTLCRRMRDASSFTVGELYLLSRVIKLREVI